MLTLEKDKKNKWNTHIVIQRKNVLLKSTLVSFWIALSPFSWSHIIQPESKKEKETNQREEKKTKQKTQKDVLSIFPNICLHTHQNNGLYRQK